MKNKNNSNRANNDSQRKSPPPAFTIKIKPTAQQSTSQFQPPLTNSKSYQNVQTKNKPITSKEYNQPIKLSSNINQTRKPSNLTKALALNKSNMDILDKKNFAGKIHPHREKVPGWVNMSRKKHWLIIGAAISGAIILVSAIAVPTYFFTRKPFFQASLNWRHFITSQQLFKLTEIEAQDVIDQYNEQWPMWVDIVDRSQTVISGIDSNIQVESITVFDPTPNVWTQPFNINEDLEFKFESITHDSDVSLPENFIATFGNAQGVEWKDQNAAENRVKEVLLRIEPSLVSSTDELEIELKKEWNDIKQFIAFDQNKIDDIDFFVSKTSSGSNSTYNVQPIITLGKNLFAAQQPKTLPNLIFSKDLIDSNIVDWDHDVVREFISSNEVITSKSTLNIWLADPANEQMIKSWFTNENLIRSYSIIAINDAPLALQPSISLTPGGNNVAQPINDLIINGVVDWNHNDVLEKLSLLPGVNDINSFRAWFDNEQNQPVINSWFSNSTNANISVLLQGSNVITLMPTVEIKPGFISTAIPQPISNLRVVESSWNHNNVTTAIAQTSQISSLQTLNNWLNDSINQTTIKNWFTNPEAIVKVSIIASGNGPFTLVPHLQMQPGFINANPPTIINNVLVSNAVNWNLEQVKNELMNISSIINKETLEQWLASASNQTTIRSWFSNNQNASISVSVSGNGPFTLVPNIVMNPGYANSVVVNPISNFVFEKSVNWISIDTIKNQISNQAAIFDESSMNAWLADASNQPIIKSWFTQSTYIESVEIQAIGENTQFLLDPININMKPGFENITNIGWSSRFKIEKSISWLPSYKIQNEIIKQQSVTNLQSLNNWLNNSSNRLKLFTNSNSINNVFLEASGQGTEASPFSIRLLSVSIKPGIENTSSIAGSVSGIVNNKRQTLDQADSNIIEQEILKLAPNSASGAQELDNYFETLFQNEDIARQMVDVSVISLNKDLVEEVRITFEENPSVPGAYNALVQFYEYPGVFFEGGHFIIIVNIIIPRS